jgi:hypothetical protein
MLETPTQEFHQVRAAPVDIEVLRAQVRQIEERRRRVTTALPFGPAETDARFLLAVLRLGRCMRSPVAGRGGGCPLRRRYRGADPRESPAVSLYSPLPLPRPT